MAGIGFELRKIYKKKTLFSTFEGFFYSTFAVVGPAVVFAILMLTTINLMGYYEVPVIEKTFFVSSFTHVFLIALMISVLLNSVISRYVSDMIFLDRDESISSSVWGVLTLVTVMDGIVMAIFSVILYWKEEASLTFILSFYCMGILAAISYCLMTYISAVKEYKKISIIFVGGALICLLMQILVFGLGYRSAAAAYFSMVSGFAVIDSSLIISCVRRFGKPGRDWFAFLSYFKKYPEIFWAGTFYGIGFYLSNLIYWYFSDMITVVSIFPTAPNYDMAMFFAIFINLPSVVIFSVSTETDFFEKYVSYLSSINNGQYRNIDKSRKIMIQTMSRRIFFVYDIQLAITLSLVLLCMMLLPYIGINAEAVSMIVILAFAVYATLCMYFTITLIFYFDDGKDAAMSAAVFLTVEVIFLILVLISPVKLYTLPLLMAGLSGWLFSFWRLKKLMDHIDGYILCRGGE